MLTTGNFRRGGPGDCPVCGAKNSTCAGDGVVLEHVFLAAGYEAAYRFRSTERVFWINPTTGQEELRYGVGTPIPLFEALRQGLIELEGLFPEERDSVVAHARANANDGRLLAMALKKRKDKMARPKEGGGVVVTKG